jgi:predicted RNA-binding protein
MNYYLNLFSPETYETFTRSAKNVSGFVKRQIKQAEKIKKGDKLICYLTKVSRWVGVLEVVDGPFQDSSPIFYDSEDPFIIRFKIKPMIWLDLEKSIPIHDSQVWEKLSFTKENDEGRMTWTAMVRSSLRQIKNEDGQILEKILFAQAEGGKTYPYI